MRRSRRRSWFLIGSPPVEAEIDEQFAFHLEMRTRQLMSAGISREAARAEAERRFGDLSRMRDECRDIGESIARERHRMEYRTELRHDVSFALRMLRRNRVFTAIALVTLALGIGAGTAVFSVVERVLLRGLPYHAADRLVLLWNGYTKGTHSRTAVAPAEFADVLGQQRVFSALAAVSRTDATVGGDCTGGPCEPERASAYRVSPGLFRLLGVAPALGRDFVPDEGRQGSAPVAVLSHAFWMRRFGGDSGIVGRTVRVDDVAVTVVGVMPSDVRFPDAPLNFLADPGDLWMPYAWEQNRSESRGNQYLGVVARLRDGVTPTRLRAGLDAIAKDFRDRFPDRYAGNTGWNLESVGLRDEMVGDVRTPLLVLLGAVTLVLLVACINVANLLLARGAIREKELAIRRAIGAGLGRIVRQLLTESLVLAIGGGALGIVVAWWGVGVLERMDAGRVPLLSGPRLDGWVLAFSLAVSLATGLLFGLAPVLQQRRANVQGLMKDGMRGHTGSTRGGVRGSLVVAEIAMTMIVLVGAGLLLRSFVRLGQVSPGFRADDVLTFELSLPRARYDSVWKLTSFARELRSRLGDGPGVAHVGAVYPLPMSEDRWGASFVVEGLPVPAGEPEPHAEYATATPGYFQAMGISLLAGRDFTDHDEVGAPEVVIVDEALARRYWPGESAVGKRVNVIGRSDGEWATVVGVVAHVHNGGPAREGEPQLYLPYLQRPQRALYVVASGAAGIARADALASAARAAVRGLDPEMPVARLRSMASLTERAVAPQRFNTTLLGVFAAVTLLLAAVGLYGVMSQLVAQRVPEIGVRLALGGGPAQLLFLVLRRGLVLTLTGLAIGLAGAFALSRVAASLLFGVSASDPITYAGVSVLLLLVGLAATLAPARRATRIDPVEALRSS